MYQPEPDGHEGAVKPSPVRRVHFSSRDEEEVTDFIRTMCVGNRSRLASAPQDARFEMTTVMAHGLTADRHRSTIGYSTMTDPFDHYFFLLAHHGSLTMRSHDRDTTTRRGDVLVYPVGVPLSFEQIDVGHDSLRLPCSRLGRVAEETTGLPGAQLRFEDVSPISPAMREHWRATAELAHSMLMAEDLPMSNSLLAEEVTRTVAVVALHTFPNTTMTRQHVPGPGPVAPAALRRAVAYIDTHAQRPVTLSDIAAAAGVRPRALQEAFRRHHATTPMGYLRRVRLEHAHHELQAADPTRGDTVVKIAARWGFAAPGRFARAYRDAYGHPPSHTLRT